MTALPPDVATVQALRRDVAFQLARYTRRMGVTQIAAAKRLDLPQPTLSKIVNGHVSDVSLELLIRTAVRAGLPITLQTGHVPEEAGAFTSGTRSRAPRALQSGVADAARRSLIQSGSSLSPSQRLEAFLEHNQLVVALHEAGRAAEARRVRRARRKP